MSKIGIYSFDYFGKYCVGGIVIMANDYNEAKSFIENKENDKLFGGGNRVCILCKSKEIKTADNFLLVNTVKIVLNVKLDKPVLIFNNYDEC